MWLLIKQVLFLLRLFTANVPQPCTATSPSPGLCATRAGSRARDIRRSHDMASGLSSAHSDRFLAWSSIIDWCINGLLCNVLYFKLVMLACNIHYTVYNLFLLFWQMGQSPHSFGPSLHQSSLHVPGSGPGEGTRFGYGLNFGPGSSDKSLGSFNTQARDH